MRQRYWHCKSCFPKLCPGCAVQHAACSKHITCTSEQSLHKQADAVGFEGFEPPPVAGLPCAWLHAQHPDPAVNRDALQALADTLLSDTSSLNAVDLELNSLQLDDVVVLQPALATVCAGLGN